MPQAKPTPFIFSTSGTNTDPGAPKKAAGFVAEKPSFAHFNWLFNEITKMLQHVNDFGIPAWDVASTYSQGSIVMDTSTSARIIYRKKTAGTLTGGAIPPTNTTDWEKLADHIMPAATTSVRGGVFRASLPEILAATGTGYIPASDLGSAFNSNYAAPGYLILPGGIILQWGAFTESAGNLSFPMAFPTACLAIYATHKAALGVAASACNVNIISASQFTLNIGASGATALDAFVFAVGT